MSVALYGAALCHSAGDSWIDCCSGAEDLPLTQADSWALEVAHDLEFYWSHEWGIGRSHHSGDGTVVTICLPLGVGCINYLTDSGSSPAAQPIPAFMCCLCKHPIHHVGVV
jgi:hypothetical protein